MRKVRDLEGELKRDRERKIEREREKKLDGVREREREKLSNIFSSKFCKLLLKINEITNSGPRGSSPKCAVPLMIPRFITR